MLSDTYEQFHALALSFYSIPLFPLLYAVHSTIAALHVRKELGQCSKITFKIAACTAAVLHWSRYYSVTIGHCIVVA